MPEDNATQARHYALVARSIAFIQASARQQPSLEQIAGAVHVSPTHLQKVFAEWAGLSPKRFLQYLTKQHALRQLKTSGDLLTVTEDTGLSSTSRLHDLMVSCEAMTPGEIKRAGDGLQIGYGFAPSPFGEALIGWTERGICHFAFTVDTAEIMTSGLFKVWPNARFDRDDDSAEHWLLRIFPDTPTPGRVHLVLRGTNFQIKVWEALIHTEFGQVISYQRLAERAGCARASRAVGSAMAANSIAYLIPCHRVIRESGEAGHYRWGADRKLAMLAWEAGRSQATSEDR